jgi:hypothetical protein
MALNCAATSRLSRMLVWLLNESHDGSFGLTVVPRRQRIGGVSDGADENQRSPSKREEHEK